MSINSTQKLKQLQTQASTLEADLQCLADEQMNAASKKDQVSERLKAIQSEMELLKKTEPVISEHAIIRYLQRVKGLDIEEIKNAMLDDRLKHAIVTLGDGKYPIGNGHYVVVKNRVIVTVYSRKPIKKIKQRRKNHEQR